MKNNKAYRPAILPVTRVMRANAAAKKKQEISKKRPKRA
jgi:hypothetical protein